MQTEIAKTKFIKGEFIEELAILAETEEFQQVLDGAFTKVVGLAKDPAESARMTLAKPLTLTLGGKTVAVGRTLAEVTASWELNGKALGRQVIGNLEQGAAPVIQWVTLADVRSELAHRPVSADPQALLIEYAKYLDGTGDGHYAGWVIPPAGYAPGGIAVDVTLINLGPASPLEGLVGKMEQAINQIVREIAPPPPAPGGPLPVPRVLPNVSLDALYSTDAFVVSLRNLSFKLLWQVEPKTWAIHRWYISPAAETWLVPFPAFPIKSKTPGQRFDYALEQHDISYLISGRDLITLKAASPVPARC